MLGRRSAIELLPIRSAYANGTAGGIVQADITLSATPQHGFDALYEHFIVGVAPTLPGDCNHDGSVGFSDLLTLAQNYGTTSGATFEQGDLNGDGRVDFQDLLILAQNYGTGVGLRSIGKDAWAEASASPVPEPSLIALVACAVGALSRRRRCGLMRYAPARIRLCGRARFPQ